MSYFNDTYADDIQPVLSDWTVNSRSGKAVSDLHLSLANRAQKNLWSKKPWGNLVKTVSIVPDENNQYDIGANLTDFGRIVDIAEYQENTPVVWYHEGIEEAYGYRMDADFDKTAGYQRVMTFNYTSGTDIKMRYVKVLPDFTGVGIEYSYFPSNLVILEAQKINSNSKGNSKEYQLIMQEYNDVFNDFKNSTQYINKSRASVLRDRAGNPIRTQQFGLMGTNGQRSSIYPNSRIPLGRR